MNSSTLEGIGRDKDIFLTGLTKSVADDISQLMVGGILKFREVTWEEFVCVDETKVSIDNCPQAKKFKQLQSHNNRTPRLEELDTTFLACLIEKFDTNPRKNESVKRLRNLRNLVAHGVAVSISAEEYSKKVSMLLCEIEFFQKNYPNLNFEKIKKDVEEKKYFSEDLPTGNIRHVPKIAGRVEELRELEECLNKSQVVLVTGPAGIGKTTLAEKFAEAQTAEPSIIGLFVSMKEFKNIKTEPNDESEPSRWTRLMSRVFGIFRLSQPKKKSVLELENEISSVIGKHFDKIREAVSQSPNDAFVILQGYVNSIPKYAKLFIILDNIDGFNKLKNKKILENVITRLCPTEGNIKFICTSRNWMTGVDTFSSTTIALDRIKSRDDVSAWFSENAKNIDATSILEEAVLASDQIPLLMNLLASRLNAKNRPPIRMGEIANIKLSTTYEERIDDVLSWSFKSLSQDLQLFMQSASVFPKTINESALKWIFQQLSNTKDASAVTDIQQLADLSLIHYNSNNQKYYMHPYIQEYTQKKCSERVTEAKYLYFVVYYLKLMEITQDQLTKKGGFNGAIETILDDIDNYHELLKVERKQFVGRRNLSKLRNYSKKILILGYFKLNLSFFTLKGEILRNHFSNLLFFLAFISELINKT